MKTPGRGEFDSGWLDVGAGNRLYWEASGSLDGKPAVVLHGGPGSGCAPWMRDMFDPKDYRVVLFDQRQCGRSTPHAAESSTDLATNTTEHLIEDCERLRDHLGIDRWLVWGGSWGTTLGLAYGQAHPGRVTEMILVNVCTTTRAEVDWITRSMGRLFPAQWERFVSVVPSGERDGDLSAAYARLLQDADPVVRETAAQAWCEWEDTHVSTYAGHHPDVRYDDPRFRMCFARIVTHYWSHAAFIPDGQLVRNAHRLRGTPGVLINGRLDISGPPDIAWHVAHEWPDAELVLTDAAGHGSTHPSTFQAIRTATERFASSA